MVFKINKKMKTYISSISMGIKNYIKIKNQIKELLNAISLVNVINCIVSLFLLNQECS